MNNSAIARATRSPLEIELPAPAPPGQQEQQQKPLIMKSEIAPATFRDRASLTVCRSCGHRGLMPVVDLGRTALVDTLVPPEKLGGPENKYPLAIGFCSSCSLVQTLDTVPPHEVFHEDYTYYASFSETWLDHCRRNALNLIEMRKLDSSSLVIEIASNDGYLLKNFVERQIPVLGIDACPGPVRAARKIGVPTMHAFFDRDLAIHLAAEGQRADVVIANNVMAHVADLNGFVAGIRTVLKDDGVLVTESPYVRDLIEHNEFDTMYHEHLCYYSVTALDHLFRRHGLFLNDIERIPTHGGSIRSYVARHEDVKDSVGRILQEERAIGVDSYRFYETFGTRVEGIKQQMLDLLHELKRQGKRIAAYGASAKGSTMLSYLGAGPELIEFVVDRNVHKQGKFMPGVHNPIYGPEAIAQRKPDYLLLLVWNLKDEIMRQQDAFRKAGGKFIVPVPSPTII
jgi:SAM-dependent methyltransferase